jgi:hypothetical protein
VCNKKELTVSDPNLDESYALAAALACQWLASYNAEDGQAAQMLGALRADPRGLELAFGALSDVFLNTLNRLDSDGALPGGTQLWIDRLAMNVGAAADEVIARHQKNNEGDSE